MRTLLVVAALATVAQAQEKKPTESAATVVARVQKYYDSTKDLRAKFEQQIESASRAPSKASGEVWLKKPGKMRWDYAKPEKKLMVSDGATLWVYEPEDEQAYKQDLKGNDAAGAGLVSARRGQARRRVRRQHDQGRRRRRRRLALKMVPKIGTTAYRYLVFVVDGKSGQVKQHHHLRPAGRHQHTLSFIDVQQNKGVDDGKFKFSPPSGTHILKPPSP